VFNRYSYDILDILEVVLVVFNRYSSGSLAIFKIFNWYSSGIFGILKIFWLNSGSILGILGILGILEVCKWYFRYSTRIQVVFLEFWRYSDSGFRWY